LSLTLWQKLLKLSPMRRLALALVAAIILESVGGCATVTDNPDGYIICDDTVTPDCGDDVTIEVEE
jgi:hypothetical protein